MPTPPRIAFVTDVADSSTSVLSHSARHTLARTLEANGVSLEGCLLTSLVDRRVDLNLFKWEHPFVQVGIARLLDALATYAPNLIVALGNDPRSPSHAVLHLLKCGNVAPPSTKSGKVKWEFTTGTWRGSLFVSASLNPNLQPPSTPSPLTKLDVHPMLGASGVGVVAPLLAGAHYKVLASWHPSFVNRAWAHYLHEFRCDVRRACEEGGSAVLALDTFDIEFGPANDL